MSYNGNMNTLNINEKLRYLPSSVFASVLLLVFLFIAAGDIRWISGWIYTALALAGNILNVVFLDADLLGERSRPKQDYKRWDLPLALIVGRLGPLALIVVAGLDHRFGWSGNMPVAFIIFGFLLFMLGYAVIFWAMHENRFFSGVVRIQKERGHRAVTGGPYKVIRHPGYLGIIVYLIAAAFALESWWALIPAFITGIVVTIRTGMEDRTLKQELEGYAEYAGKVRYHILPGIW